MCDCIAIIKRDLVETYENRGFSNVQVDTWMVLDLDGSTREGCGIRYTYRDKRRKKCSGILSFSHCPFCGEKVKS